MEYLLNGQRYKNNNKNNNKNSIKYLILFLLYGYSIKTCSKN